uniref:Uncharacterized protein n=1 Tax=Gadus morhua TaxID=8049 RepID=A0A8C5BQ72_GADMO
MEVIISAAEMGFTGSLVGSNMPCNTHTLSPLLTMFRVSMPREQSSVLLLWEPPHWCLSPNASWMSSSCLHTLARSALHRSTHTTHINGRHFRGGTFSSTSVTGFPGKLC